MKQELNASKVFSSMTVFDMLRNQLSMVSRSITNIVTGKVSLERIAEFLAEVNSIYELSKGANIHNTAHRQNFWMHSRIKTVNQQL